MPPGDELWFDNKSTDDLVQDKIEAAGSNLKSLTLLSQSFLLSGRLYQLSLPNLKELVIPSLYFFDQPEGWKFLHSLTNLEILVAEYTEAKDSILQGLYQAPWWEKLTQLELKLASLKDSKLWQDLWLDRSLNLRILCLFFLNRDLAKTVLSSKLPRLEFLVLGTELGDDFLLQLSQADLPLLTDLDLSHAAVTEKATLDFLNASRPGLPNLARVRKRFFSEKQIESYDWNGSPVGYVNEELSDQEIQEKYFAGTGLKVLPASEQLNIRGQRQNRLRPLERPAPR